MATAKRVRPYIPLVPEDVVATPTQSVLADNIVDVTPTVHELTPTQLFDGVRAYIALALLACAAAAVAKLAWLWVQRYRREHVSPVQKQAADRHSLRHPRKQLI